MYVQMDSRTVCSGRGTYVSPNSVSNCSELLLQNVDIQLLGNLNFQQNITAVQSAVISKNYKSGWFLVTGRNISLVGPGSATKGGVIRGYGQVRRVHLKDSI